MANSGRGEIGVFFKRIELFEKTSKKVLTDHDIFAIITFVAPQGSNEAANAAGLLKSLKLNNFKKKKNQVIPS